MDSNQFHRPPLINLYIPPGRGSGQGVNGTPPSSSSSTAFRSTGTPSFSSSSTAFTFNVEGSVQYPTRHQQLPTSTVGSSPFWQNQYATAPPHNRPMMPLRNPQRRSQFSLDEGISPLTATFPTPSNVHGLRRDSPVHLARANAFTSHDDSQPGPSHVPGFYSQQVTSRSSFNQFTFDQPSFSRPVAGQHGGNRQPSPPRAPPGRYVSSAQQRAKRRRKAIKPEDMNPEQAEAERSAFLERNRQAAARSRHKKKDWVDGNQDRMRDLQATNNALKAEIIALRAEILDLKTKMLQHESCGCVAIRQYLHSQANSLVAQHHSGYLFQPMMLGNSENATQAMQQQMQFGQQLQQDWEQRRRSNNESNPIMNQTPDQVAALIASKNARQVRPGRDSAVVFPANTNGPAPLTIQTTAIDVATKSAPMSSGRITSASSSTPEANVGLVKAGSEEISPTTIPDGLPPSGLPFPEPNSDNDASAQPTEDADNLPQTFSNMIDDRNEQLSGFDLDEIDPMAGFGFGQDFPEDPFAPFG